MRDELGWDRESRETLDTEPEGAGTGIDGVELISLI